MHSLYKCNETLFFRQKQLQIQKTDEVWSQSSSDSIFIVEKFIGFESRFSFV